MRVVKTGYEHGRTWNKTEYHDERKIIFIIVRSIFVCVHETWWITDMKHENTLKKGQTPWTKILLQLSFSLSICINRILTVLNVTIWEFILHVILDEEKKASLQWVNTIHLTALINKIQWNTSDWCLTPTLTVCHGTELKWAWRSTNL